MSRHRLYSVGCKLLAVALLVAALPCLPLMAQANATGAVTGTVTDSSGAVIVGATVALTSRATSSTEVTKTNSAGQFVFHNLFPAAYGITVSKSGFQTLQVADTHISVNKTIALNLRLQVGSQSKTIEVSAANSAALQTLNPTMSSTLNAKTLLELPSLTRDVTSLLNLQPTTAPSFHVE
ncbi:MAG: carboxypeptidase-like regulatory domain-containing protein, partial [Terriglobales bacterium]